jgi:hypothetical protein
MAKEFDVCIEGSLPVVQMNGLNTEKAVSFGSTVAVAGAATFTGATSFTGATNGIISPTVVGTDATYALTAAMSGGTWFATKGSATQTYTLPAVSAGLKYTFICGHASGEILVNPTGSVVTTITTFGAVGSDADTAIIATAAGTGIKNTAATNAIGDSITLISDGTGWYSVGITSGIWASQ